MLIEKLIQAIHSSTTEAHEAALALGLLIERERVNHQSSEENDDRIREILGDELSTRRLSQMEINTAVDELIRYIDEAIEPDSMAIWALTKSYEPRVIPHLVALFDKVINDVNQENLTYQTLLGIINIGVPSKHKDLSLEAIRKASEHGYGQAKETATRYLELF